MAGGTFVLSEMIQHPAFLSLRGGAPQLLLIMLNKRTFARVKKDGRKSLVCTNDDNIVFTYIEAQERYGITPPRFNRSRDDLLAKGFLEVAEQGGSYRRHKSVYKLSDKWRIWRPGVSFCERKPDAARRGFQGGVKSRSTYETVAIDAYETVAISHG